MVSAASPPRLSIVVPMLNEERNIVNLLDRLFGVCRELGEPFEVICIDDGSTDATPRMLATEEARRPELRVVTLARNFGQHSAIIAGFDASRGEWVITIDADLQNPPEEIPRLVAEFRKGHDLIGTIRQDRQDNMFRKAASWTINRVVRRFSRIELTDFGCMLRGYSGEVARSIADHREYRTFIPALGTLYASSPVEIPVSHAARAAGTSKYSVFRLFSLALDLLTCFSLWPLRLLFACGVMISTLGVGFGLLLLLLRVIFGTTWAAEGVFTLFAILFIFIGAQFFAFGLLGEYVGRIFQEVRDRPAYVVRRAVARAASGPYGPPPGEPGSSPRRYMPGQVSREAARWVERAKESAGETGGEPRRDAAADSGIPAGGTPPGASSS